MAGSEQVFNDVLVPGMSLNLQFVGGAGGDIQAPGDYLFLDRRQPFMEGGLWLILRVTGDGKSGGTDAIVMEEMEKSAGGLAIEGWTTMRPAGDFARSVTIHAGDRVGGVCTGPVLGTVKVDPGSGRFSLVKPIGTAPDKVCVASSAGGVLSQAM